MSPVVFLSICFVFLAAQNYLNRRHERRMRELYEANAASNERLMESIRENTEIIGAMSEAVDAHRAERAH